MAADTFQAKCFALAKGFFGIAIMLFFGWIGLAAFFGWKDGGRSAQPPLPVYAVSANGREVFLWINAEAWDKAFKMKESGIAAKRPDLFLAQTSCIVTSGTRVSVLHRGSNESTIMVADGPRIGCEGLVSNKLLKDNPDAGANKG